MMDLHAAMAGPRRSRHGYLLLALACLFAVLSVQYAFKVKDDSRSAIVRWRSQILDLGAGVNIYERHGYPNPPIMALLLTPLAQLPPLAGSLAWFFLKATLTLLAVHWLLGLVEIPGRPFPAWAKALAVLLSLRPIIGDLTHGNVNLFILFLVAAGLHAYSNRRDARAGLLLALAIACKVTPALFLPYFAWKRSWRALAGCGAGLVLFLGLVPACFLGVRENNELLGSWLRHMVLPYVAGGAVTTEHQNQSLPGVVCRLTTAAASFSEYHELGYVPIAYHNLVDLPDGVAHWLVRCCMVAFACLLAWSCRTPRGTRERWRLAAELGLVTLGMLLFSERTWKHHCVTHVLPVAVVLYHVSACRPGPRLRRCLIGSIALAVLLMTATGTGLPGISERAGKLAEVYGAYLWAHLVLVAALVVLLRCRDGAAQGDSTAAYHVDKRRLVVTAGLDRGRLPWPARLSPERGQGGVGV
jgi:hypothetical protein